MNELYQQITDLSKLFHHEGVEIRRYLHQNPELSTQEVQTAAYISQKLHHYGIENQMLLGGTAVVAVIEGKSNFSERCIALRADIDALPIEEQNKHDFVSKKQGVMHACGHDAHITFLLTVAHILKEMENCFSGKVKLLFQPSEEHFPGGAIQMIEAGVLENPHVEAVLACHVSPEIPIGKIGIKQGDYMASTDELYMTITGKGGHAALPALFINPLLVTSEILLALEPLCQQYGPKETPSVLTFGKITGKGRTNVVPDTVTIEGTLRTFDEQWRKEAYQLIESKSEEIAKKRGASVSLFIDKGYPVLTNDVSLTQKCEIWAKNFIGQDNVLTLDYRMTAEDFAYFNHYRPSFFYRVGTQIEGLKTDLHANNFDINEQSIQFAPALMTVLALEFLSQERK